MSESLSAEQIRKVLTNCLDSLASAEDREKAISIWESGGFKGFSDVQQFISNLQVETDLAGKENELRIAMRMEIARALSGVANQSKPETVPSPSLSSKSEPEPEPDPDPASGPNLNRNTSKQSAPKLSDQDIVFNQVLDHVAKQINKKGNNIIDSERQSILENIGANNLSAAVASQLRNWHSTKSDTSHLKNFSLSEMSAVVHGLYVWICEHNSPVAADKILENAIRESEKIPEAHSLSPRKLL